jgi:hypothetical protein
VRVDGSPTTTRSTAHSFDIRRRSFCLLVAGKGPAGQPVPLLMLRAGPDEHEVLLSAAADEPIPQAPAEGTHNQRTDIPAPAARRSRQIGGIARTGRGGR